MKIVIDTDSGRLMIAGPEGMRDLALSSPEGFAALAQLYHQVARMQEPAEIDPPIEPPPDELFHLMGVIDAVHPTAIVVAGPVSETLIVHLAKTWRETLIVVATGFPSELMAQAELPASAGKLLLLTGSVTAADIVERVQSALPREGRTLVALQTSPTTEQAKLELEACAPFVSVGSYLIATDGTAREHRIGQIDTSSTVSLFAMEHSEFRLEARVPNGAVWLRRVK